MELRLGAALVDCRVLAGDDDLAGAVVVRRPDARDAGAEVLDHLVLQPEDRRHRARVLLRGRGHRQAPLADERYRLLDSEGLGCRQGGELADRVADDEVRPVAVATQGGQHGEARGDQRRLLHLGLDELLLGRLEAEPHEIEPGGLARPHEDVHRLGHCPRDLAAHAHLERALARKAECDLFDAHARPPSVHSIKPEPHVSPAPIPVISTSLPACRRPSAFASASASGIEPEDVFP